MERRVFVLGAPLALGARERELADLDNPLRQADGGALRAGNGLWHPLLA